MTNEIIAACAVLSLVIVVLGGVVAWLMRLQGTFGSHGYRLTTLERQHGEHEVGMAQLRAEVGQKFDRIWTALDDIRQWVAEQRGAAHNRRDADGR